MGVDIRANSPPRSRDLPLPSSSLGGGGYANRSGCGLRPRGGRRAPGTWSAGSSRRTGGQAKADLTLSRKEWGGFSAGHAGLSLLDRGEHAFTEIQAFPLPTPPSREYPSRRTSMAKWRRSSQSWFMAPLMARTISYPTRAWAIWFGLAAWLDSIHPSIWSAASSSRAASSRAWVLLSPRPL